MNQVNDILWCEGLGLGLGGHCPACNVHSWVQDRKSAKP